MRSHKKVDKRVERAKEKGNIFVARRISMWDDYTPGSSAIDTWCYATYEYEFDGKVRKYKYMGKAHPPVTLKLYYENPKKPFSAIEERNGCLSTLLSLLFYIIPIAVAVITIFILGGV